MFTWIDIAIRRENRSNPALRVNPRGLETAEKANAPAGLPGLSNVKKDFASRVWPLCNSEVDGGYPGSLRLEAGVQDQCMNVRPS